MILRVILMFVMLFSSMESFSNERIINGKEVEPGTYKEIVSIRIGSSGCTATVIGPRVILTAAHCGNTGENALFKIDGVDYSARITQSPKYKSNDHDIALGVTSNEIQGIEYASVANRIDIAKVGLGINLLGYGCTTPGGGTPDGKLRIGATSIVNFSNLDMVSRQANGAALCYGDSGGPAYLEENGKKILLGVNSKGNIYDTNYNTRIDIKESQDFIQSFISSNNVEICGINKDCSNINPPTPPTCVLSANPQQIKLGESLTLVITVTGDVTKAYINDTLVSDNMLKITPNEVGTFSASGKVVGPGGEGTCSTSYVVESVSPNPPSCSLVAIPSEIKLGESLTLELTTKNAKTAKIDGVEVSVPLGKKLITPDKSGNFTALGEVVGDGGSATCSTTYSVINGPQPPPEIPNYALIPSYCGENKWTATEVKSVCLSVIKKDSSINGIRITTAVYIQYKSGAKEAMPVIMVKELDRNKADYILYANGSITAADYLIFDTRKATVTKIQNDFGEVPIAIEGRTKTGQYFMVDELKSTILDLE